YYIFVAPVYIFVNLRTGFWWRDYFVICLGPQKNFQGLFAANAFYPKARDIPSMLWFISIMIKDKVFF
ncbi:MAG: hypothetical protein J7K96_13350, partial [Desulfobacteraceae bacterium]|nr:hypothetical protein [Desulfobacteraceae bacterium]